MGAFWKKGFSKICYHTHTHTGKKVFLFSLLFNVLIGHRHRSVDRSVGWSVTVVSGSIRTSPPGFGIWRLVAAIECVKIIVNFSDTHHTSMGRLSATPCQGQWQRHVWGGGQRRVCVCVSRRGYKVGTSHWRGNQLKTLVGPTLFYEVLYI